MNTHSGYGEIEVGGELLHFKFGLNAYQLFCQHRKISLPELGEALSGTDTIAVLELAYFAYVTEAHMRKEQPELNITQFIEAVNDQDTMEVLAKINEIMTTSKFLGKTVEEWTDKKKVT